MPKVTAVRDSTSMVQEEPEVVRNNPTRMKMSHSLKTYESARNLFQTLSAMKTLKSYYNHDFTSALAIQKRVAELTKIIKDQINDHELKNEAPIYGAVRANDVVTLRKLIIHGAMLTVREPKSGGNILHTAVLEKRLKCAVEILLEVPILAISKYDHQKTPLKLAKETGQTDMVQIMETAISAFRSKI